MFKKTYYGAHIAPACAYCLHGSTAADPKMILCKRKGVVSVSYTHLTLPTNREV